MIKKLDVYTVLMMVIIVNVFFVAAGLYRILFLGSGDYGSVLYAVVIALFETFILRVYLHLQEKN